MTSSASKGADEKFCSECAAIINRKAEICPKCGVRQANCFIPSIPNKNKMVAGLLALVFGSFGIHKFYLGKPLFGIIYIIFAFTFIPAIIGVVEGIIYLCTSDEDFARKYCSKTST